ncbi:hypothetical protein BV25DRAFT_1987063 [Artomyces pyxidatus]|uniref:Uncharacterized protein n=1 Tax=Artomyces pyxidatus TaxID=48021 RepID=A0ACB8TIF6_9AGAM|nr:hypothetical protein BV25DRAFT_1987063 [Artomyces pyxidatus]
MSDPRFARLKTDPRFRRPKKHTSKVVVDERFKSIFQDDSKKPKQAKGARRVDKYGRPLADNHETDNLRHFYRLEDDEQVEAEPATGPDYARGEILLESSEEDDPSDDDSDSGGIITLGGDQSRPIPIPADDDDAEVDLNEDNFADLDAQATAYSKAAPEDTDEGIEDESSRTRRIAVVNLDWDHVRAIHLYKIFASVLSSSSTSSSKSSRNAVPMVRGKLLNVRIYPSQFGKERMEREEKEGPPIELLKKKVQDEAEINERTIYETGNADEYDEDALRTYQLERLRYFYAIVECDGVDVASHLYSELQGTELERSANVFDLSFVPDDMSFDEDYTDEASAADAATDYKGLDFVTDALRHSRVKLTWDQDDPERDRVTRRTLSRKEIEENNFHAYIASSSESEPETPDADSNKMNKKAMDRDKLRALLLGGGGSDMPERWGKNTGFGDEDEEGAVDMEVTFMPALSSSKAGETTTLETYQQKMKEKRKKRKEEWKAKANAEQPETSDKLEGDDFFGESGSDGDGDEIIGGKKGKGKKGKGDRAAQPRKQSTAEELALLVAADKVGSEPKHFDMNAVIKAEKRKGKKSKKTRKVQQQENEIQEDFDIDVKDERFEAVHEDHAFAIDPSNPHFKKTKSMSALLEERSKRRKSKGNDTPGDASGDLAAMEKGNGHSLKSLVESVKRKSATADGGVGKRRKL